MSGGDAQGGDNPLWDFSLALYGADGVETACLALQDEAGLDVNLILLACFLGARGVRIESAALAGLAGPAEAWRTEVIAPLRALRRRLKDASVGAVDPARAAPTRQAVKAAELEAERAQQAYLFQALQTTPGRDGRLAARDGLIRLNLLSCLDLAGVEPAPARRAAIEALVAATRALAADGRL